MIVDQILGYIGQFLGYTWWFWVFLIIWPLFKSTWRFWREEVYLHSDECKAALLELKVPRETTRNIQAMEQALTAMHQMKNAPGNKEEWWIDGEVTRWFSLEMVSFGGEIHFYIRVHFYKQKRLLEAAFYAFYQDVELVEVPDYIDRLPSSLDDMYSWGYNLWGTEMILTKPDAYPIKTYKDFESPDEEKQYDPIAQFIELFAKVAPEEIVAIQILAAPHGGSHDGIWDTPSHWPGHYTHLIHELRHADDEAPSHHDSGILSGLTFEGGILPASSHAAETKPQYKLLIRTPGETDVLKKVEENLSKLAFETVIRFIYLAPAPIFWDSFPRRGLRGAFNQYAANDLNSFAQNEALTTNPKVWDSPYIFTKRRNEYRKARLIENYRHRNMPPETFMGRLLTSRFFGWNFGTKPFLMTTQCLATLFHPPTAAVLVGPHMERVVSRKVGAPAGLAIFSDESELERYQQ